MHSTLRPMPTMRPSRGCDSRARFPLPLLPALLLSGALCPGDVLADPPGGDAPPAIRLGRAVAPSAHIIYDSESETIRIGAERHEVRGAHGWQTEAVSVDGLLVAVVRFQDERDANWAAIIGPGPGGRAAELWFGRLGLHGDPGERLGHSIKAEAEAGLVRHGVVHESARLCGLRELPLLQPRQLVRRGTRVEWSAVDAPPPRPERPAADLPGAPGAPTTPRLPLLAGVGQSSTAKTADRRLVSPPSTLVDGNVGTGWQSGGTGVGEFVTFRLDAGDWGLERIGIVGAGPAASRERARAKTLWLLGEHSTHRLQFASDPANHPGAAIWFTLPAPVTGACLSLWIEETYPAEDGEGGVALQEVIGLSSLDGPGGLTRLVAALATDDTAARLLQASRVSVAPLVAKALPGLPPAGRVRAIRVLRPRAADGPEARQALVAALGDDDERVRTAAMEALLSAGPSGVTALAAQVTQPDRALAVQVASMLARAGRHELAPPLLEALTAPAGADRARMREALTQLVTRAPASLAAVETWSQKSPPTAAAAAVALALSASGTPAARALGLALARSQLSQATEFPDRYRLVLAARQLPADADLDAWLLERATKSDAWMLRAGALRALSARDAPSLPQTAEALLLDRVPRVRASAVEALATRGLALAALAKHTEHDVWYLVRAAAVAHLPDSPTTRELVRARAADPSAHVRRAAIERLTGLADRASWPAVQARMSREQEFADVVEAAIGYASALCVQAALPDLEALVARGLGPDARETGRDLAVQALAAMARLGSPRAKAMAAAFGGGDPEAAVGLQRAVTDAAQTGAGCTETGVPGHPTSPAPH